MNFGEVSFLPRVYCELPGAQSHPLANEAGEFTVAKIVRQNPSGGAGIGEEAAKVIRRPRKVGVGPSCGSFNPVCFLSANLKTALRAAVRYECARSSRYPRRRKFRSR
jgi:hypothetical protein